MSSLKQAELIPAQRQQQPLDYGFRMSVFDGAALVLGALITVGVWPWLSAWSLLLPLVLGHFFLFCNVIRLHPRLEYTWSALFIFNFGAWLLSGQFTWFGLLLVQTPVTLLLVVIQMRSPFYCGLGAWYLNPHLRARIQAQQVSEPGEVRAGNSASPTT